MKGKQPPPHPALIEFAQALARDIAREDHARALGNPPEVAAAAKGSTGGLARGPRPAKVSKADLNRLMEMTRRLGVQVAAIEVTPGKVRVLTTAGVSLSVPGENVELDQELAEWRARNGLG